MSQSQIPTQYLFVYGSLRQGFQSEAYHYISHYFDMVGAAKVKGFLIDMGSYPAAVPTNSDHFINGELYSLKNREEHGWAFGQLDDYEGVVVEADEMALYRRALTTAQVGDQTYTAWIYWYNADVTGKPIVASGDIFEYLKNKQAIGPAG
jgi:gamma-glutamylcyclotransferase (GGCT)/AIG2-like uncharacterized protein YtfP